MSDEAQSRLYEKLVDVACMRPERQIREHLVKSAQDDARAVASLVMEAYTQGVRDGFQQGVQAMADDHEPAAEVSS